MRSLFQIHFAQQGVVARVGAEGIEQCRVMKLHHHQIMFVDRFVKTIKGIVDFTQAKEYPREAGSGNKTFERNFTQLAEDLSCFVDLIRPPIS